MPEYALIGDIGGTNARFALTDMAASEPQILHEKTFTDRGFQSLGEAARSYLDATGAKPKRAALAVASPIDGDEIKLTNRDWSFRRSELKDKLGLDELRIINDFAAIAWAAPYIDTARRVRLYGEHGDLRGPVTLVGAGTGLGVGLLVGPDDAGWRVVPTEGGHASFAPLDDVERAIAAWLVVRHGGRVSNERVVSGEGLSSIDAALRGIAPVAAPAEQPGVRTAEEITDAALAGTDADARCALDRFCSAFGAVAGDAALMHGASTVLVAGGMVLHFLDYLADSGFMHAFGNKGRHSDHMKTVAVQVITHENPGLLGAAVAARQARPAADS